jgi:hypothetical protein
MTDFSALKRKRTQEGGAVCVIFIDNYYPDNKDLSVLL